jgi:flagellar hook-associated protein 2
MSAVTFTGLSSGIDTASLVSQLVAAERAPADAIAQKQSDLSTQKSIVGSLSSALAALGTAVQGMNLASELQPRTASSSDSHVTVAASSGAAATVHDIRVQSLARGQISSSRSFTTQTAGVLGDGSLKITTGSATSTINYASTDSLADVAAKINDANAGASASVLFDGTSYRLMVAATQTGTANAPQFTETGDGLGLADPANIKIPATDAKATIDGVDVTRSTNVIGDAVDGLTLTLNSVHATSEASSNVTVALDTTSVATKLTAMVSAYNAVNSALHVQLDYTGTQKGTDTLFGDSTLRGIQGALGNIMSSAYGTGANNTLGSIGLSRDTGGALTLDTTKLNAALAKNPNAVADVFVTGGFANTVNAMTTSYTRAGDGILAAKSDSLTSRSKDLQTQADEINNRADALKTQLDAQFAALEIAMTTLKQQSSYITSVLG